MTALDRLVAAVKQYALDHYSDGGWDFVVEAWTDEEIADHLMEQHAYTISEAVASFSTYVSIMADREADAINSAF